MTIGAGHERQSGPARPPGGDISILVVDDESDVRALVSESLARQGYHVTDCSDGRAALDILRSARVDLMVLDLGLPGLHGLDLLTEVRRSSAVPVIILSGRGKEADRILGLKLGADDYLVKPFFPGELVVRVETVLRRSQPPVSGNRLEFEGLVVDCDTRDVLVAGRPVELTTREFDLLAHLASTPKRVHSRSQLLREVWGSSPEWKQEATITEHVRRLRQKIEADPDRPRWIKTVRGVGYRFNP